MPLGRPGRGHQSPKAPGRLPTLTELLDRAEHNAWRDVKSWQSLRSNIKFLNERLGSYAVEAVSAEVLENFVDRMFKEGYAAATIKRRLAVLGRALSLAVRWGIIAAKPAMPEVRVRNGKDRVLSAEEETAVFRAIQLRHLREPWRRWDEFGDLVRVLLDTGARLGEAIGIKSKDITTQGDNAYVTFAVTKNDKPRTIPLTPAAQAAIEKAIGEPCGSGMCVSVPIWHFNQTKAWFFWSIIREEVGGLDDVTLHTLRHTALTRLARGGMDLLRLQKWAGHSDPRITAERYTHLQPSDLDGGLAILEGNTK